MLSKRTAFVLGAGASAPYGFPTGAQLSSQVISGLQPGQSVWASLIGSLGIAEGDLVSFRDAFRYSGKQSVDAFLEHRGEYLTIGKAATAQVLIRYESTDSLFDSNGNWYRYVFNKLNSQIGAFGENAVSFITFNYDRSLEQFLFTALKNTYGVSDEMCADLLKDIPIIHLHGRLGYLPWQDGGKTRPYSLEPTAEALRTSIENIKIIHENISDGRDEDFSVAKTILDRAERVYFLGFGYDQTNMMRLGISDLDQGKASGTAMGLGDAEIHNVRSLCNNRILLPNATVDCSGFLRTYGPLN